MARALHIRQFIAVLLLAGCNGDTSTAPDVVEVRPSAVHLTPAFPSQIKVGETVTLAAEVYGSDGELMDLAVVWEIDNEAILTIEGPGVFRAIAPGGAIVRARYGDLVRSTVVWVRTAEDTDKQAPVLTGFSFSPATTSLTPGSQPLRFRVDATDDVYGVRNVWVILADRANGFPVQCWSERSEPGTTALDGTWLCEITPSQTPVSFVGPGDYYIQHVVLEDGVKNAAWITEAELRARGFPTQIRLTK